MKSDFDKAERNVGNLRGVFFCREIGDVGVSWIHSSAQRDWEGTIRQPAAASVRPMAQHHRANTESVRKD